MMRYDTQRSDEMSELRQEVAALRDEMRRMRAERDTTIATADGRRPHRRRRRRGDADATVDAVSRRRLFGLLGGGAAAAAGLAAAGSTFGAERADAADGDPLLIGRTNTASNPGTTTSLDGSVGGPMLFVVNSSASGIQSLATGSGRGVAGLAFGDGAGVYGRSGFGSSILADNPGGGTGVQLMLQPGFASGPPTAGSHDLGQFWLDSAGALWQCVVAGTPGTWVGQSPLVPVNPPARVYDSRVSDGPISNGQTRAVTVTGTFDASTIPTGISLVLTNLNRGRGKRLGLPGHVPARHNVVGDLEPQRHRRPDHRQQRHQRRQHRQPRSGRRHMRRPADHSVHRRRLRLLPVRRSPRRSSPPEAKYFIA
jgi:hypothetical protein